MTESLAIVATRTGFRLDLRVMPRSPRTAIEGIRSGRLLIRVTAPPVDDAANDAVVAALASALNLPRSAIRIVSGATARNKTVEISGIDESRLRASLSNL